MLCTSRLQPSPLASVRAKKRAECVSLSLPVHSLSSASPMHSSPRRHTGNWGPRGSQANMQGLGVTWLLDQIPSPSYGKIVPLPCGCLGRGKGYGSKPRQKIRSGAPKAVGQRTAQPSGSFCSQNDPKYNTLCFFGTHRGGLEGSHRTWAACDFHTK